MVEVAEKKDLEALEREIASLRAGIAGLTEAVERHQTRGQWVLPIPDGARLEAQPSVPGSVRIVPKPLAFDADAQPQGKTVADVAALGPFRASPYVKDQILTAGGAVFLALYDGSTRDAVLALLNR